MRSSRFKVMVHPLLFGEGLREFFRLDDAELESGLAKLLACLVLLLTNEGELFIGDQAEVDHDLTNLLVGTDSRPRTTDARTTAAATTTGCTFVVGNRRSRRSFVSSAERTGFLLESPREFSRCLCHGSTFNQIR